MTDDGYTCDGCGSFDWRSRNAGLPMRDGLCAACWDDHKAADRIAELTTQVEQLTAHLWARTNELNEYRRLCALATEQRDAAVARAERAEALIEQVREWLDSIDIAPPTPREIARLRHIVYPDTDIEGDR